MTLLLAPHSVVPIGQDLASIERPFRQIAQAARQAHRIARQLRARCKQANSARQQPTGPAILLFAPAVAALTPRLSLANNQIARLVEPARRELGEALEKVADFLVSFVAGDGYNFNALTEVLAQLGQDVRRIGREHCGHGKRVFSNGELPARPDAMRTNMITGAAYGPGWNETNKEAAREKLRKLVKRLAGVDLTDAEIRGQSALHGEWEYRLGAANQNTDELRLSRYMPAGWRGNVTRRLFPLKRGFTWNEGPECRAAIEAMEAEVQRIQTDLSQHKGGKRAG